MPRTGDGWGSGFFSRTESVAQAWRSFARIALRLPGFVTALPYENQQTDFRRGAVSVPSKFLALILPGLEVLDWPVKMPSSREGDRYFSGCAHKRSDCSLPLPS
jgi:hypothetical protein